MQALHKRRQYRDSGDIGGAEAERAVRGGGAEGDPVHQRSLQQALRLLQQFDQFAHLWRRLHAVRSPNEKRIFEVLAKPGKAHTDGRLAEF